MQKYRIFLAKTAMKQFTITFFLLCASLFSLTNCSTTNKATTANKMEKSEPVYRELIDIISKQPGVQVKKVGGSYDITIRSKGTFLTSHQPLYVVDGLAVGTSYDDVANMVQVTDVDRIRVLKGSEATQYGSRGGNGVIEIYLKKGL
ncbi:MAG: TonB-dependent receptor plug domain-containing protein [Saprospiraceae bacterium]|nr:TonB-dependent receptor plug domain-containing protein [Saprospiraceae bacterium]